MGKRSILQNIIIYTFAILLVIFCLFPFVQTISVSFKFQPEWGTANIIPKKINLTAYKDILGLKTKDNQNVNVPPLIKKILSNPKLTPKQRDKILSRYINKAEVFPFFKYFKNSLFFSFVSSIISVILAILGAYSISRLNFKGRTAIQRGILFVYMIGGVLLMIPLYQILTKLGLTQNQMGARVSILLIYILSTIPVALFMFGNFFRTFPTDLEDAGLIDGCTRMQVIIKIVIPLSIPMIATVFVYCFIIGWNEYLFASVFLAPFKNLYTLPIGLTHLFTSKNAIWDRIMAASLLTILPVLMVYGGSLLFNKAGSTLEGGIKG